MDGGDDLLGSVFAGNTFKQDGSSQLIDAFRCPVIDQGVLTECFVGGLKFLQEFALFCLITAWIDNLGYNGRCGIIKTLYRKPIVAILGQGVALDVAVHLVDLELVACPLHMGSNFGRLG